MPSPELPVDLLNGDAGSTWSNLGYWSASTRYSDAAAALATHLGEAIRLGPDDAVLDVGCGFGESLVHWVRRFGVSRVAGVEASAAAASGARARVRDAELSSRITVHLADAADELPAGPWNALLALDCAYHFDTRRSFLASARKRLPAGGRLGMTDLVVDAPDGSLPVGLLSRLAPKMGISPANLVSLDRYRADVEAAGFADVACADLTGPVLAGFSRWAGSNRRTLLRHPRGVGPAATGALAGWAARRGWVRYVLVTARVAAS